MIVQRGTRCLSAGFWSVLVRDLTNRPSEDWNLFGFVFCQKVSFPESIPIRRGTLLLILQCTRSSPSDNLQEASSLQEDPDQVLRKIASLTSCSDFQMDGSTFVSCSLSPHPFPTTCIRIKEGRPDTPWLGASSSLHIYGACKISTNGRKSSESAVGRFLLDFMGRTDLPALAGRTASTVTFDSSKSCSSSPAPLKRRAN
jgi:hypothetical protein